MSEQDPLSHERLRKQLLTHLTTLRGAGVEWLPRAVEAEVVPEPTSPPQPEVSAKPQVVESPLSLLEIADEGLVSVSNCMTLEQRRTALQLLADEVKGCTRCAELCAIRRQTVFAQGEPGVELCVIGEAPGEDEDIQGLPFVGAAGQMLNRILAGCGLKREEIYVCNIVKCHPPRNRTPLANEAANCREFLERQLELVQPKYIVALGGCAATNLLGTTLSLGKLRGRFHNYRGIPVMVTYHPSYLLPHRDPSKKRDVWEDMKMLLTKMGRPIPKKGGA